MEIRGIEKLGAHLAGKAREFGAVDIIHVIGPCFVAKRPSGKEFRMIADEGIGSCEGEEGFDDEWNKHVRRSK